MSCRFDPGSGYFKTKASRYLPRGFRRFGRVIDRLRPCALKKRGAVFAAPRFGFSIYPQSGRLFGLECGSEAAQTASLHVNLQKLLIVRFEMRLGEPCGPQPPPSGGPPLWRAVRRLRPPLPCFPLRYSVRVFGRGMQNKTGTLQECNVSATSLTIKKIPSGFAGCVTKWLHSSAKQLAKPRQDNSFSKLN